MDDLSLPKSLGLFRLKKENILEEDDSIPNLLQATLTEGSASQASHMTSDVILHYLVTFSSPAHYCHPHSILLALSLSHRPLTADKKLTQIIRGHSLPGAAERRWTILGNPSFHLSTYISIYGSFSQL